MMKADIVNSVAQRAQLTKRKAQEVVEIVFEEIKKALGRGERVQLVGFGSFSVRHKEARQGRNPQTGAPLQIEARNVPVFKPGAELRKLVNTSAKT